MSEENESNSGRRESQPRIRCVLCGEECVDESELESHVAFDHLSHTPFPCSLCRFVRLPTLHALHQHWHTLHTQQLHDARGALQVKVRVTEEFLSKEAELRNEVRISLNSSEQSSDKVWPAAQNSPLFSIAPVEQLQPVPCSPNLALSNKKTPLSRPDLMKNKVEETMSRVQTENKNSLFQLDQILPATTAMACQSRIFRCQLCPKLFSSDWLSALMSHVRCHMANVYGKSNVNAWKLDKGGLRQTSQFKQMLEQCFPSWRLAMKKNRRILKAESVAKGEVDESKESKRSRKSAENDLKEEKVAEKNGKLQEQTES